MKLSKLCKVAMSFLTKPYYRTRVLIKLGYYDSLSDEEFLKKVFPKYMGYPLDLENPKTFSEKLQWLKVNYREPIQIVMVDKHEAKNFIAQRVGEQYIIRTLAVWDSVEDIDFDALPNQFVLKTTHGGGGCDVIVCKDKRKFDKEAALVKLTTSLTSDLFKKFREWPYKNVPKRIIAEKFMQVENAEEGSDLKDYKFFCFNGKVRFFKIDFDRFVEHHANYYSPDGKLLPFGEADLPPVPSHVENMPENLAEMIQLAEKLSVEQSFLRVDFYNINGLIYFGELTFYPASGMGTFTDENIDLQLGSYLKL